MTTVLETAILETKRLLLRPPAARDGATITVFLADYDIAKNTARVPYPYRRVDADAFIADCAKKRKEKSGYGFVIARKPDLHCLGIIEIHLEDGVFELGYWLGKPYWGAGYATEASIAVLRFAFGELCVEKIAAGHMVDNPASGRVLAKLGFVQTGTEERHSNARGRTTLCHLCVVTRDGFEEHML